MTPTTDEIKAMADRLVSDQRHYVLPFVPAQSMSEAAAMLRLLAKERGVMMERPFALRQDQTAQWWSLPVTPTKTTNGTGELPKFWEKK